MYEHMNRILTFLPIILLLLFFKLSGEKKKSESVLRLTRTQEMEYSDLMAKIDTLEQDIARRLNYEVELVRDPLALDKIMKVSRRGNGKGEATEQRNALRLSCTILSGKSKSAVIKYRSKSYVLKEGELIAGHKIESIGKKEVLLSKNGKTHKLINKPAPAVEKRFDTIRREQELKL